MLSFNEIFVDNTKYCTKIKTDEYHETGKNIIVDQGQNEIAGYTDLEDGLFSDVPAIIFGDHTRIIKYVDKPFFIGADGVKVLKSKYEKTNYKYLYYALKNVKIPNTGYNRHFKWLKEAKINYPEISKQKDIVSTLNLLQSIITHRRTQLEKLDLLVKARFVEMFGDCVSNNMNWKVSSLESVCDKIYGGGTPSKSHIEYYENGDIPWVSSKDMKYNIITDSQIHINELGVRNSTVKMIPVNSVIMVIRSGILKHTLPIAVNAVPITINQDLKAFIPNNLVLSIFLAIQFKMLEKDILSGVRAVTADNIEFNSLKQRNVIVPPLNLQTQFADFVKQVDKSKVAVQKALDEAQMLFDSLMQEYFG